MMTWRLATLVIAPAASLSQTVIRPGTQDGTLKSHLKSGWSCAITEQFGEVWEL